LSDKNKPVRWVSAKVVFARYGKSDSTIRRWIDDPNIRFPPPTMFKRVRSWLEHELDSFDERMIEQS
jgi:predicted DNA-binding transcriptional regulator AlpA